MVKSGQDKTGAVDNSFFNVSNGDWYSDVQVNLTFASVSLWRGLAMLAKLGTNRL